VCSVLTRHTRLSTAFQPPAPPNFAYDAADLRRAIEAYKFFYGTVATEAIMRQGIGVCDNNR